MNDLTTWYESHAADYDAVKKRLSSARYTLLHGHIGYAAENLRLSYLNAVFSIQTDKERHENAFMAYVNGTDLKEASLMTVYGGQKHDWISRTMEKTNWENVASAVRAHIKNGRFSELLEMQSELVGVSYTKWAFTLSMCGVWELACMDSNTRNYFGIDKKKSYKNGDEYMNEIQRLQTATDIQEPTFVIQWAIYDNERGEHARHMPFFRNICLQ